MRTVLFFAYFISVLIRSVFASEINLSEAIDFDALFSTQEVPKEHMLKLVADDGTTYEYGGAEFAMLCLKSDLCPLFTSELFCKSKPELVSSIRCPNLLCKAVSNKGDIAFCSNGELKISDRYNHMISFKSGYRNGIIFSPDANCLFATDVNEKPIKILLTREENGLWLKAKDPRRIDLKYREKSGYYFNSSEDKELSLCYFDIEDLNNRIQAMSRSYVGHVENNVFVPHDFTDVAVNRTKKYGQKRLLAVSPHGKFILWAFDNTLGVSHIDVIDNKASLRFYYEVQSIDAKNMESKNIGIDDDGSIHIISTISYYHTALKRYCASPISGVNKEQFLLLILQKIFASSYEQFTLCTLLEKLISMQVIKEEYRSSEARYLLLVHLENILNELRFYDLGTWSVEDYDMKRRYQWTKGKNEEVHRLIRKLALIYYGPFYPLFKSDTSQIEIDLNTANFLNRSLSSQEFEEVKSAYKLKIENYSFNNK